MKKIFFLMTVLLSTSLQAQLLDLETLFDVPKIAEGVLIIVDSLNQSAEKIHVIQKEKVDFEKEWMAVCRNTQYVRKVSVMVNNIFKKWNFDQKSCLPLTHIIDLQNMVLENCADFYTKSVPMNSDNILEAVAMSYEESKKIMTECTLF